MSACTCSQQASLRSDRDVSMYLSQQASDRSDRDVSMYIGVSRLQIDLTEMSAHTWHPPASRRADRGSCRWRPGGRWNSQSQTRSHSDPSRRHSACSTAPCQRAGDCSPEHNHRGTSATVSLLGHTAVTMTMTIYGNLRYLYGVYL